MHCFPISGHEILRIRRELPVAAHLNGNSREFKFRPRKDSITVRISCLETSQSQLYHVARLFATVQLYFISLLSQQTPLDKGVCMWRYPDVTRDAQYLATIFLHWYSIAKYKFQL